MTEQIPRLLLDADPDEELVTVQRGDKNVALVRDPFDLGDSTDNFVEHLERLGFEPLPEPARPRPRERERPRPHIAGAPPRRKHSRTPNLAEVELPAPAGLIDRLLGPDERKRLVALQELVSRGAPYDRFGFSPEVTRNVFPLFYALYRFYFRVKSQGHENLPKEGAAILAGNHGGLLPFDGAMGIIDILMHTDPPRLLRTIVDRWAGSLPWVNVFYARVGQIVGTRENFNELLADGQFVLVFPEGMDGITKNVTQRYRVQPFRVGFIEHALRTQTPIVPMAFLGSDDQAPILYDMKPLAKRLGLPMLPITPTFPWFGPAGLLPYPVSYKIVYGEPLHFHERFGPEGADDSRLVRYLAKQVRRSVQLLIDRNR